MGEIRISGCDDSGQSDATPDEFRTVAALTDIDPSIAVVDAEVPEVIYIWSGLDRSLPEIDRYFILPECVESDAPMELEGPWLSIPGTDANKEADPVPPYQVEVLVLTTSSARYTNAELRIDVPPSLGIPITQADVEESLWGGGSIRVTATCDGGRFVAERVMVLPPS